MNYGDIIRQIRTEKGLKQDMVAHRLGISQGAYSAWERGETEMKHSAVPKLAEALEIEIPELLLRLYGQYLTFNNHNQKGGNAANIIINQLSEKVIELYEKKIALLEAELLKKQKEESKE